jgi:hypothetical protein
MFAQASKRIRKRVVQSIARKRSDPSSLPPTPSKAVHERLSHLEAKVALLGSAFDQNADAYDYSFKMVEAMQHVLQRVFNDWVQNGEFTYVKYELPDWHEYMKYYWLCRTMADFASWLSGLGGQVAIEQSTLVAGPTVADERIVESHIFGG